MYKDCLISACFDCFYLLISIGKNVTRFLLKNEETKPIWYSILYPYVIYPLLYVTALTSIYTVVVLSFERLHALTSPLTHEPHFWPYFLMILSSPICFIIPFFFIFHLDYDVNGSIIGYSRGTFQKFGAFS